MNWFLLTELIYDMWHDPKELQGSHDLVKCPWQSNNMLLHMICCSRCTSFEPALLVHSIVGTVHMERLQPT